MLLLCGKAAYNGLWPDEGREATWQTFSLLDVLDFSAKLSLIARKVRIGSKVSLHMCCGAAFCARAGLLTRRRSR